MKALLNIGLYQAIWFLCVLGGNKGALVGLLLVGLHLMMSVKKQADLCMMALLALFGIVVDGALVQIGFFSFAEGGLPIPFWLLVIWLGLATTVHHSLAWMKTKQMLALFFGAIGGPAAYWGGVHLGAAQFHWGLVASLGILAVLWGIIWPVILYLSGVVDRRVARCSRG